MQGMRTKGQSQKNRTLKTEKTLNFKKKILPLLTNALRFRKLSDLISST